MCLRPLRQASRTPHESRSEPFVYMTGAIGRLMTWFAKSAWSTRARSKFTCGSKWQSRCWAVLPRGGGRKPRYLVHVDVVVLLNTSTFVSFFLYQKQFLQISHISNPWRSITYCFFFSEILFFSKLRFFFSYETVLSLSKVCIL